MILAFIPLLRNVFLTPDNIQRVSFIFFHKLLSFSFPTPPEYFFFGGGGLSIPHIIQKVDPGSRSCRVSVTFPPSAGLGSVCRRCGSEEGANSAQGGRQVGCSALTAGEFLLFLWTRSSACIMCSASVYVWSVSGPSVLFHRSVGLSLCHNCTKYCGLILSLETQNGKPPHLTLLIGRVNLVMNLRLDLLNSIEYSVGILRGIILNIREHSESWTSFILLNLSVQKAAQSFIYSCLF